MGIIFSISFFGAGKSILLSKKTIPRIATNTRANFITKDSEKNIEEFYQNKNNSVYLSEYSNKYGFYVSAYGGAVGLPTDIVHSSGAGTFDIQPRNFRLGTSTGGPISIYPKHDKKLNLGTSEDNDLLVLSGSKVGIGTGSPNDELEVYGNGADTAIRIHEDAGSHKAQLHLRSGGNDVKLYTSATDNKFHIDTESLSQAFTILTDGKIGIGTGTPLAKTHIKDSVAGPVQLFIHNSNGATNTSAELVFGTWSGAIPTGLSNPGPQAKIQAINLDSSNAKTDLAFFTYDSSGDVNEVVRITNDGHFKPSNDNEVDLGAADKRFRNVFTGDLELSNEGTEGNEVDGTTGKWTIQEGDEDLFIINRKTGKKYKFLLQEIE